MPPRKDLMRIIRSDQSFAATLGFGTDGPSFPAQDIAAPQALPADPVDTAGRQQPEDKPEDSNPGIGPEPPASASPISNRGVVIYVAVSLTQTQSIRAERWAAAASCPIPLLMRRTAQGMRKEVFDLWAVSGVERVEEQRGARGVHPTSITLTLCPDLAAAFSAQLDPLGIIGLGRAIGPAFRKRFEAAFDMAAEKAGF